MLTWPGLLRMPGDLADHDVRSQPPHVQFQRLDSAVSGDQKRQHIKTLAVPACMNESHRFAGRLTSQSQSLRRMPGMAFDQRLSFRGDNSLKAKQAGMGAGCDHAVPGLRGYHNVPV